MSTGLIRTNEVLSCLWALIKASTFTQNERSCFRPENSIATKPKLLPPLMNKNFVVPACVEFQFYEFSHRQIFKITNSEAFSQIGGNNFPNFKLCLVADHWLGFSTKYFIWNLTRRFWELENMYQNTLIQIIIFSALKSILWPKRYFLHRKF